MSKQSVFTEDLLDTAEQMCAALIAAAQRRGVDVNTLRFLTDVNGIDKLFGDPSGEIRHVEFSTLAMEFARRHETKTDELYDGHLHRVEHLAMTLVRRQASGKRSVLQDWVHQTTFMQQGVLIAAVRGPDGIRKNHPVKVLCRWLRRCILISCFEKFVFPDSTTPGGGSFTGPCRRTDDVDTGPVRDLGHALQLYLESVDELPHHFQLHFMHAAEILGYKHPNLTARDWWFHAYEQLVNDAHLHMETEEEMDRRLGDTYTGWKAREGVTAL